MKTIPPTIRGLQIVKSHAIMAAQQFGYLMWPTNPAWHRVGRSGHGVARGVGMRLAAGAFLAKLHKKGYITNQYPLRLTKLGEAYLLQWEDQ